MVIYISRPGGTPRRREIRVWRSLVSRLNGVQEAAGSNPVTRTTEHLLEKAGALFFCICFPNQRPPAPKARFDPPLPGGQAQPALPLVRIQSLGPY